MKFPLALAAVAVLGFYPLHAVWAFCVGSSPVTLVDPSNITTFYSTDPLYTTNCTVGGVVQWYGEDTTYIFCDESEWVAFNASGTDGSCSDEGAMDYDNGNNRYEFCDGSNWIPVVSAGALGGCASTSGTREYDPGNTTMRWCDGSNLQSMKGTGLSGLNPRTANLVGHWKLDEDSGAIAADSSGKGYDGTLENMAGTEWEAGKVDNAIHFDGDNDYIEIPDNDDLSGGHDLSWSFWLNPDTTNGRHIFRKDEDSFDKDWGFQYNSDGRISFYFENGDGNDAPCHCGVNESFATGEWNHFAATYDHSTRELKLYTNGNLDSTYTLDYALANSNADVTIGRRGYSTDSEFDGLIDDVRVYDAVISEEDVLTLYLATNPGDGESVEPRTTNLVGHWDMDDGSGSTAIDLSGNGNDGTLTNMDSGSDWVDGKINGGLDFDGANDMLRADDMIPASDELSISLWAYPDNWTTPYTNLISQTKDTGTSTVMGINFENSSGNIRFTVRNAGDTSQRATAPVPPTDEWIHITGTYDGSTIRLYYNGVEVGTPAAQTGNVFSASNIVSIGSKWENGIYPTGSTNAEFDGILDEVRIYDVALSPAEIETIYRATVAERISTENGLVGHWTFDEVNGETTAYDDGSGGNDGTLTNMDENTDYVVGKVNRALDFDGADDFVSVPDDTDLDITDEITLSAWVYGRDWTNNSVNNIVSKRDYSGGERTNYQLSVNDSNKALLYFDNLGTNGEVQSTTLLDEDKWYHVTATYDGENMKMYLNGVLDNTVAETNAMVANGNVLSIGRIERSSSSDFAELDGLIDDVRVYDRALNASEVLQVYYQTGGELPVTAPSAPSSGLVGHWKLDETSGATANDDAAGGNDGSLTNFATTPSWINGKTGGGLSFDGADDYIDLSNTAEGLLRDVNAATVAMWMNIHDTSVDDQVMIAFSINSGGSSTNSRFSIETQSNDEIIVGGRSSDGDGFNSTTTSSAPLSSTGVWKHVVGVIDYENDDIYIYIDGQLDTTELDIGFAQTSTADTDSSSVAFGAQDDGSDDYYNGRLDDIRVYNRALSASEISDLYFATGGELFAGYTCADGSVYAGKSPDGDADMFYSEDTYTTSIRYCQNIPKNMSMVECTSGSGYTESSCNTGQANTELLAIGTDGVREQCDGSAQTYEPHAPAVAKHCDEETADGKSDWYSPAINELKLLIDNVPGVADTTYLWSSSETSSSQGLNIATSATIASDDKNYLRAAYCTRQDPCDAASPDAGTVCHDGTVYAGTSEYGLKMFTTRCDVGQTWNGSSCTGSRDNARWDNSGNVTDVDTGITALDTGINNTNALVTLVDADTGTGGFQAHSAAQDCYNLVQNGYSDWYLPAHNELGTLHTGKDAIGNFLTDGTDYWGSSDVSSNAGLARARDFSSGSSANRNKTVGLPIRCVRREDPCDNSPTEGDVCNDGRVYAGDTPDGSIPMYTTRCDYGHTWNGASCGGSRVELPYNDGNTSDQTFSGATDLNDGDGNTETLLSADSDAYKDGQQPHAAARACADLLENGNNNWYLPAQNELAVLQSNRGSIGNFTDDWYLASTENSTDEEWVYDIEFDGGAQTNDGWKNDSWPFRCVSTAVTQPEYDPCKDSPTEGDVCADGTIYVGDTPDGSVPMYTTRCDQGQSWDGTSCSGARHTIAWNDGSSVNPPPVMGTDATDGDGNTAAVVLVDSDTSTGGFQDHDAAMSCNSLVANGHDDWYLPADSELDVIYASENDIGNFDTSGVPPSGYYWTSTEMSTTNSWALDFSSGTGLSGTKNIAVSVRCARHD